MKCTNCNTDLKEGLLFCPTCGAPVASNEEAPVNAFNGEEKQENDVNVVNEVNNVEVREEAPVVVNNEVKQENVVNVVEPNIEVEEGIVTPLNSGKKSMTKKQKRYIILGVALVVLIAIIGIVWKMLVKSPKQIFDKSIDVLFKTTENYLMPTTHDKASVEITYQGTAELEDESMKDISDIISKLTAQINYRIDMKQKKLALELKTNYDQQTLLNMNAYLKDQSFYVELPGVYDKLIKSEQDETTANDIFETDNNQKDSIVMIRSIKNAVKYAFKDKYFKKGTATIRVNGKDEKVTSSSINMDGTVQKEINKDIFRSLKNNEAFIKSYANSTGKTENEVIDMLTESIENIDDSNSTGNFEIAIYTSGMFHEFKGLAISQIQDNVNNVIQVVKDTNEKYSCKISSGETELLNGSVTITGKENNKTMNLEISIKGMGKASFTVSSKIEYNKDFAIPELSQSIDMDEMTSEESQQIMLKLLENEGIQKLVQKFQEMTTISNDYDSYDDYDYDYDYDYDSYGDYGYEY